MTEYDRGMPPGEGDVTDTQGEERFLGLADEEIVATYPVGRFTLEVEATLSGHVKRVSYWET